MTGSEGRGRSGKRPLLRGGRDDRGRGDAGAGSGPLALSLWGGEGAGWGDAGAGSGPLALSLWGGERAGRGDAEAGSGPLALSLRGGERAGRGAAQAQGLRPFAMWLAPHIHTEKYRPENPQAASRPVFYGMTARLVEKLKNPLTTGGRSDNV